MNLLLLAQYGCLGLLLYVAVDAALAWLQAHHPLGDEDLEGWR